MKRTLALVAVVALLGGLGAMARGVYRRLKGPPVPLCSAPLPPRSAFSVPVQLSSATTPGARRYDLEPAVALLPDGALAMAWNARDPLWKGTSGLVTARVERDALVDVRPLPTERAEAFDAWMTVADDGVAHLVWLAHDGGRPEVNMAIEHATSRDGRTWVGAPTVHAPADCPPTVRGCLDKPMVVPGTGGVVVLYSSREALRAVPVGAHQSTRVAGGAYASIARTPSGALHVAVVDSREGSEDAESGDAAAAWGSLETRVAYLRSDDGAQTWKRVSFASADDEPVPFFFSNPQVAVDEARGVTYVAYPTGGSDGAWVIRLASSRDGGQSWSRVTVNDDAPCASHMAPQVALDPRSGAVHLTWLENRSGVGALVTARCESGGAHCGPNHLISTPFASYSFERHLPAWLSEYGALVVDDAHRTLHAVWTQPVFEDGTPTSRIFHASAPLD